MHEEERLDDLLVQWGEASQRGERLSAEQLCADCPELIPALSERIKSVELVQQFIQLDEEAFGDFLQLPDFDAIQIGAEETRLLESKVPLEQFRQRLSDSELLDAAKVEELRIAFPADDSLSFAKQLVAARRLTPFQAVVLLEGRELPLVLDRYVLLDEIGAGGMGAVYKALHQQMDRVVALKILPKSAVDSAEKAKRFQREVIAAAKLEHPNIVTAFDAREEKGIHFLVMSLVDGQDLAKLIRMTGPLSAARAVDYIAQAARGLEHAHELGVVHRDIKPANLLLDSKGTVKILDMGLARIENAETVGAQAAAHDLTQAGMVMGTAAYLAPEQAVDTRDADARSDIYSLGCTLYFLLHGRPLFTEETIMKTLLAHREREIPSIASDRIPVELDQVFRRMVAKRPEDRYQSIAELLDALQQLKLEEEHFEAAPLGDSTSKAFEETATLIDTSRQAVVVPTAAASPPRRWIWGIAAVCLLALAGFGGLWAAGVFLRVETPAGVIVLEIDQPELAGAEVTVDGQKKITIRTGSTQESIELTADEESHLLKVSKGGFETFTKQFRVSAGKLNAITVHLEPLKQEMTEESPAANPASIAADQTDGQRRAAEMVVRRGGTVEVTKWDGFGSVSKAEDMPKGRFAIQTVLLIDNQQVTDDDLAALSDCMTLSLVHLHNASQISDKGIAIFADKTLGDLWLNGTRVTDAGIRLLPTEGSPENLHLEYTAVGDGACDHLAKMSNLHYLGTQNSSITDVGLAALAASQSLRILSLGGGLEITEAGLRELAVAPRLGALDLSRTSLDDAAISSLAELKNLYLLNLHGTNITSTGALELQKRLPNCAILHPDVPTREAEKLAALWAVGHGGRVATHKSGITYSAENPGSIPDRAVAIQGIVFRDGGEPGFADGLANLAGICAAEYLHFNRWQNADAGLANFAPPVSLLEVKVADSDVTAAGVSRLEGLKHLRILELKQCFKLDDEAMNVVPKLPALRSLILDDAKISDSALAAIGESQKLAHLSLARCPKISDEGIADLIKLDRLAYLDLDLTSLTDVAIPHLSQLRSLEILEIQGTKITAEGAARLQEALPNCVVFHESLKDVPWKGKAVAPAAIE
ncbi:protein kinase [Blastopirellula sp. JC732]|uniref:non-specific serine/threonine protein kinase n=1 Tax=Blastopirellula sediminis TaxID=2894196 RepID=A0A9X1ML15_9BACT|nr:protein kinase [Blastopirellula sediminis]MCC9609053.1 protein kinase [Blastopirellula sediminis]MCC9628170.1 protein kinase [Blastopirellula sediminis]